MNKFENELIIKEEVYQNGLYPKVPKSEKHGIALVLTGGCKDDIVVSDNTTVKQIRQGKYTQLVEISTRPYIKEIRFNSPSKEKYYSFDVYVKGVIQVNDPIIFYENKNLDVDAYFDNLFSLDVKKVTRKYSILNYEGMDEDLKQTLSACTVDESTGFIYQISVVDASPGEEAQEYVRKYEKMLLDRTMRDRAKNMAESLTTSYEDAIRIEVIEGKLSEADAILKVDEYKKLNYDEQVKRLGELSEKGIISESDFRKYVRPALTELTPFRIESDDTKQDTMKEFVMDEFYIEEE